MRRVRGGAEIRPVGVLQLRDFAHGFEGEAFVGEGEAADDDVGLVGGGFFFQLGLGELGAGGGAFDCCGPLAVAVDAGGFYRGAFFTQEVEVQGSVVFLGPVVVGFYLGAFRFGG